jgi:hypothetical protein
MTFDGGMSVIMNLNRSNKLIMTLNVMLWDLPRVAEGNHENCGQGCFLLGCK